MSKQIFVSESVQVRITFGGGMGGSNVTYYLCDNIKIGGNKISFEGYPVTPYLEESENALIFLNKSGETEILQVFDVSHWPINRIGNLRSCLMRDDMIEAITEYKRTDPNNNMIVIKKEKVTACGNWFLKEIK